MPNSSTDNASVQATLVRVNARAWGIASGLLLGIGIFIATNFLVMKGGDDVGQHLGHLSTVFPGYNVSFGGSVIGFFYMFVVGYALGRLLAPKRPLEREQPGQHRHVRLNGGAWGLTLGGLAAVVLLAGTNALVMRGGEDVGALLKNLAVYLPGYEVTVLGSAIGAAYVFAIGWVLGKSIGGIYNLTVERAESGRGGRTRPSAV